MGTTNLKKIEGFLEDEKCSIRSAASQNEENFGIRSVCDNLTDSRQNDISYRLIQSILKEDLSM